jgi:hypothetical protein
MKEYHEAAQVHVDALYELIGYVLERCPQAYDEEMKSRFQGILQSFTCYDEGKDPDLREAWEIVTEASIGRNYRIAHAALLQKFMNAVRAMAIRENHAALQRQVESLDTQMEQNFRNFFAEPFAAAAGAEH